MLSSLSAHASSLALLLCLDFVASRCTRGSRKQEHTRWCALHALSNLVIAAVAWPSLCALADDPLSDSDPCFPAVLAVQLHAYHAFRFDLSLDDRAHHFLFVAVLGFPSLAYPHRATHAMLFFLSGLPGAIIYALVAARRCGLARSVDERGVSALVNLCFRAPGVVYVLSRFAPALLFSHFPSSSLHAPPPLWVALMQLSLPAANVFFYAAQAVRRLPFRGRG